MSASGTHENGHGNGKDENVARFPGPWERRRLARQRDRQIRPPREPVFNLPPVTKVLIFILLAVHAGRTVFFGAGSYEDLNFLLSYGFIPVRFTHSEFWGDVSTWISPVSHMFLHGGWLHLGINVLMLMAFGTAIERLTGPRRFLIFMLVCGLAGALAHFLFFLDSTGPMIGFSGALSGLFGGTLVHLHDQGRMGNGRRALVMAVVVITALSVMTSFIDTSEFGGAIAWATHLGGFFTGLLLIRRFQR